ncbi:solute carrier family 28 member 3-like [Babylonia areolata]|uniref:solute carrier family 28 member 3-like n=1 Tax=Babylonia areolata TaxID=304850 RepID=UPI003FD366AB
MNSNNDRLSPHQKPSPSTVVDENEPSILVLDSNLDEDDHFDDASEDDDYEEVLKHSSLVGRMVLRLQHGVKKAVGFVNNRLGGHFLAALFLLLYVAYFCYAMYYSRHRVRDLMGRTSLGRWCTGPKSPATTSRINTLRFFLRWLLYGGVGAFMGYIITNVAMTEPAKLRSLPGIFVFLFICLLFSTQPSKFILAVLVMRWQGGKEVVLWIQTRLGGFFDNAKTASKLVFGETYTDHYFVFGAVPTVLLSNAALSMLYHVGAMQFLVRVIGNSLRFVLGTTVIESTGVAASIFMEGPTAVLAIRPYLDGLTKSELFALCTACLASIGGAFLGLMAKLGIPIEYLLPAMVISAPATFTVCKLIVPETRQTKKVSFSGELPPDMRHSTIIEAAQAGALSVVGLAVNVVVSAFGLVSIISWINTTFTWFGLRVGIQQLTFEVNSFGGLDLPGKRLRLI